MAKELPSLELLHKLLRYEPETGKLYWCERTPDMFKGCKQSVKQTCNIWNSRFSGKEAFTCVDSHGYKSGRINSQLFRAHRVAWALHFGEWPSDQIDHINGVRGDNKIENLRIVTHQDNHRNQKRSSNNTSGVTGVHWNTRKGKWASRIWVGGKNGKHLGYFDSFDEAVQTRKDAEAKYGFHTNHGRD